MGTATAILVVVMVVLLGNCYGGFDFMGGRERAVQVKDGEIRGGTGGGRHHVVGGDRGWDVASDLSSWAVDRVFMVGDHIWFTFSAAEEGGGGGAIAEVRSEAEFESCDLSNPIRMYSNGLSSLTLDGEGHRYFISHKSQNCKDGLRLHVNVLPTMMTQEGNHKMHKSSDIVAAEGPSSAGATAAGVPSPMWLSTGLVLMIFAIGVLRV